MNMNEEFVNVYIEMNNKKIEDLIRGELLLQTRLSIAEKMINQLNEDKRVLQEEIDNLRKEPVKEEDQLTTILSAFENKKPSKKDKEPESSAF
jgi:predicted  nucleic acid-binding Zn-ribbon protein